MARTHDTTSLPLRALKKERTAEALRRVARDYFKRMPYEEARLTDIARDAEVSATTVYNYFPSKLELLYAVIYEDNIDIADKTRRLGARTWKNAVDAIHALAKLYFRWFDSYRRSALQALLAAAFVPDTETHDEYARLDEINAAAVIELVETLQRQGLVDSKIEPRFLGNLLFNLINAEFFAFVADESRTVQASSTSLRRQLEFVAPTFVR